LKLPSPGDPVKLRKDILPHIKVREWTFLGKSQDSIILITYKPKGRILKVVKEDDIDWDDYQKNTIRPLLHNPLQT
jgi:hypothetical protein